MSLQRVELFEVNYPTEDGLVYSTDAVKDVVYHATTPQASHKLMVVSDHDGTGIDTSKIVGTIERAAVEDDKLVLYFQQLDSIFHLSGVRYDWTFIGMGPSRALPRVIGYSGPILVELYSWYVPTCVVRKARPVSLFTLHPEM